jgi:glycosyltransferase involved in cell wall biosynthesis
MANEIILHARANIADLYNDLRLPPEKVRIIPHGHYRTAYGPVVESSIARHRLGLPDMGRIYLFFGMLRPYKGLERLITEWLAARLPLEDVLVIAGKPLNDDFLDSLTELVHGSPRIKILDGFVTDEKVPLFFSAANVVVLPFHDVLTSGSLLLAMSYGKAVIAPRFGAIAEMLGSADDFLYDPRDSKGLRNAIEHTARVTLGPLEARTQRVCDRLDWGPLGNMTLAAYREAIGWTA